MLKTNFYNNFLSFGYHNGPFLGRGYTNTRIAYSFESPPSLKTSSQPNSFVDKFSNEVSSLRDRQQELSVRLAQSREKEYNEEENKALLEEHKQIENKNKYLNIIMQAMQQCMQNIMANFR